MVSITQLVECQIVTLVVIGSTPITYPILYNIKKFKINDKLNLLDISSLNFFKKTVNINNLNIIFDNYDFKNKDKFLELFIKELNLKNFYTIYESIFFNLSVNNLFFKKLFKKNYIYLNFNIRNKQIYITICKNNLNRCNTTITTGSVLSLFNLKKINKKTNSALLITLKFLKNKLNILQKINFNFIFNIEGTNKNIYKLKNWIIDSNIYKSILVLSWKQSLSYGIIKKKKYSAIKKNLKKRLLKINGF